MRRRVDQFLGVAMIAFWQYFASIVIISAGYPLGQRIGAIAHDEVAGAKKYLFLFRDALMLVAIAIACFSNGWTIAQYALPLAIIISFFWIWRWYEKVYPFLIPIVLIFSRATTETFIVNCVLLFLAAFSTASLFHTELKKWKAYKHYWPVPALGVLLTILLIFI